MHTHTHMHAVQDMAGASLDRVVERMAALLKPGHEVYAVAPGRYSVV